MRNWHCAGPVTIWPPRCGRTISACWWRGSAIKVNDALTQFADRVYRIQAKRVAAGQAAAYEPLQLRVLAVQAQTQLIQSNQQYVAAWRKLALTLNSPEMAPTALGRTHRWSGAADQLRSGPRADRANAHRPGHGAECRRAGTISTQVGPDHARLPEHRHQYRHRARLHDASLMARSSACRSAFRFPFSTTTAATSSRPRLRWFGPAANTSGLATICSPTWPIPSPVTRRTGKRPSSITAVFSSTRFGPIAAPTNATRPIPTRISTTWSLRSRRSPARFPPIIQLLGDQWQSVADLAGLMQSDDIFALGQRGRVMVGFQSFGMAGNLE